MYSKINILLIYFIFLSFNISAQNLDTLINSLKETSELKNASWGLYAEYVDNGEKIIDLNSSLALSPASGLKVFTSSAALYYLSSSFKYETKIMYDGSIDSGILNGNIYIIGSGDPTLGSDRFNELKYDDLLNLISEKIKEKGIKKIHGNIIVDDLIFDKNSIPFGWNYIDIGNYYGAGTSGLCINENMYKLILKASTIPGEKVEILNTQPNMIDLTFENNLTTGIKGSGDKAYIINFPGCTKANLIGTIQCCDTNFIIKGSIPNPSLFFCKVIFNKLLSSNLIIDGNPLIAEKQIAEKDLNEIVNLYSPELDKIIYHLNKKSINLYAEQLLKTIGYINYGKGSRENGLKAINEFLKIAKINTDELDISDGSGLSRSNLINAKSMVKLLNFNYSQKYFKSFFNSLGITGDTTDISFYKSYGLGSNLEKKGHIKSGLIDNVRTHSGYIQTKSNRLISFSFLCNNYQGRTSKIDNYHIQIMKILANLN